MAAWRLNLHLSVEGAWKHQADTSLLWMEIQGMAEGGISTVLLCTLILKSCWQLELKVMAVQAQCWNTALLSPAGSLNLSIQSYHTKNMLCSPLQFRLGPWHYQSNKAKRLPQPNGQRDSVSAVCTSNPCSFLHQILGDLFVIPNLNSTLRTYNDARQNRLAGSIHAYSLRWLGAHSHGTRLFSLCWTAKKNRFRRIICTVFKLLLFWRKPFSSIFLTLHIYLV